MMSRTSHACLRCRRRKLKCDGGDQCFACRSANQICTYGNGNRKRGLVEGYVRGLERMLGFAIRRDQNLTNDMRKLLALEDSDRNEGLPREETMLESWKQSTIAKEVELFLPALEKGEGKQWQSVFATNTPSERAPQHLASSDQTLNDLALTNTQNHSFDSSRSFDVQEVDWFPATSDNDNVATLLQAPPAQNVAESGSLGGELGADTSMGEGNRSLALPPNSKQMIDEFLEYTNCWFPILEPHELLRTFHQFRTPNTPYRRDDPSRGQLAVLWAVFAHETLKRGDAPLSSLKSTVYQTARSLIPEEDHEHDLGHVQALLILVLINIGLGRWKASWILVGFAQRLLQYDQSGEASEGTIDDRSSRPSNVREHHLSLGGFVLERLLQMKLGSIQPYTPVIQPTPLHEDGLEEWETPKFRNLPTSSLYTTDIDIPAKILSTFNLLVSSTAELTDLISKSCSISDPDWLTTNNAEWPTTARSTTTTSFQNFNQSYYPQALVRYSSSLCKLFAIVTQQRKTMLSQQHSSSAVDSIPVDQLVHLASSLGHFSQIHGSIRVPVILVVFLHRIMEDVKFLVDIPQSGDMTSAIPGLRSLEQHLQEYDKSWPVFKHLRRELTSIIGLSSGVNQGNATKGNENSSSTAFGIMASATSETRHDIHGSAVPFSRQGIIQHSPASTLSNFQISMFANQYISNSDILASGSVREANAGDLQVAQGLPGLNNGVNDMYVQLAEADIMEWSGDWQHNGLRELGFDHSAFEQLYETR